MADCDPRILAKRTGLGRARPVWRWGKGDQVTLEAAKREAMRCRANIAAGGSPDFWRRRIEVALAEVNRIGYVLTQALESIPDKPVKRSQP